MLGTEGNYASKSTPTQPRLVTGYMGRLTSINYMAFEVRNKLRALEAKIQDGDAPAPGRLTDDTTPATVGMHDSLEIASNTLQEVNERLEVLLKAF